MAVVIAIVNQKGGCGKTITAINLSAALAKQKRVLIIDLDPQSHATIGLNVDPSSLKRSIFDVLDLREHKLSFKDIVLEMHENYYLAPTNLYLTSLEQKLAGKHDRENRLKEELKSVAQDYDYIIIDCPPNFGLLTVNALLASSHIIVPVETSTFSREGLKRIIEVAGMLERKVNHKLKMRFLISMYDRRTSFARKFADSLEKEYEEQVLNARIHRSIRFNESAQAGLPITLFRPGSVGSEDFRNLAKEVMAWTKVKAPQEVKEPLSEDTAISERGATKKTELSPVEFKIKAPRAKNVLIAGDFNDWEPQKTPLKRKDTEGVWSASVPLSRGSEHQYKFIVDGEWLADPENEHTKEIEPGSYNSVIIVE